MTLLDDCGQGVFLYFDNYISSYFYQFVNIIFFQLIILIQLESVNLE